MKWPGWLPTHNPEVGNRIADGAVLVEDRQAFEAQARLAAQTLGPGVMRALPRFFHHPPAKPTAYADRFKGLGEWMENCQFAIFEILYHIGQPAVPLLRKVALGAYDWTQPKAINVLCRLAADGVERERTAETFSRALSKWQYETQLNARRGLAQLAAVSPVFMDKYQQWVEEWKKEGDPPDACELIAALALHAPDAARAHEPFLRDLMRGKRLDGRSAVLDEKVRQVSPNTIAALSGIEHPHLAGYHESRAAILLLKLLPGDPEAMLFIRGGASANPDETMRAMLAKYVQEHPELGITTA